MVRFDCLASTLKRTALLAAIMGVLGGGGGGGTVTPPATEVGSSPGGWGFSDDIGYNPTMWSLSDPVTQAVNPTGSGRRFDVYNEADLDLVPFSNLIPGDVVNIFYSSTPYRKIWRVRTSATEANPIIINGVTDSNGNRPVFHAAGATVAAGCVSAVSSIFNLAADAWKYREQLALIGTANGTGDPYNEQNPKNIRIRNLEVTGCKAGNSFFDANGVVRSWTESSGIRIQNGQNVWVENCVSYDNDFGYFTQARGEVEGEAVHEPVVRNCRIYGNGMVGRSREHNIYMQARGPLIEGCFIGQLRLGSEGSSLKTRSTGGCYRYNTVVASKRLLDIVEVEDQFYGIKLRDDMPIAHVYGNLLINDYDTAFRGSVGSIHIGGDKSVADSGSGSPVVTDADLTTPSDAYGPVLSRYMHTVYFYNNTVVYRANSNQEWRITLFDLSLSGTATNPRTTVHEFNNVIRFIGTTRWSLTVYAGHIAHLGGSIWHVDGTLYDMHEFGDAVKFSKSGTRTDGVVNLLTGVWTPTTALPNGIPVPALPSSFRPVLVTEYSPKPGYTNGMIRRTSSSIGAFA